MPGATALGEAEPDAAGEPDGLPLGAAEPDGLSLGAAESLGAALWDGAEHWGSGGVTNAPSASRRSDSVA